MSACYNSSVGLHSGKCISNVMHVTLSNHYVQLCNFRDVWITTHAVITYSAVKYFMLFGETPPQTTNSRLHKI